MCFSARTKYERDAWLTVLEQLQWQYQPNTNMDFHHYKEQEVSVSNTTNSPSQKLKAPESELSDDELYSAHNEEQAVSALSSKDHEAVSYILSLTQQNGTNDNNYYYNYHNSNLYRNCSQKKHGEKLQKFTILGLLNDEYTEHETVDTDIGTHSHSDSNHDEIEKLKSIKSPQYKTMPMSMAITASIPSIEC